MSGCTHTWQVKYTRSGTLPELEPDGIQVKVKVVGDRSGPAMRLGASLARATFQPPLTRAVRDGLIGEPAREETTRIPESHIPAAWCCTLPACPKAKATGIAFRIGIGGPCRLRLRLDSAKSLADTISQALAQAADAEKASAAPAGCPPKPRRMKPLGRPCPLGFVPCDHQLEHDEIKKAREGHGCSPKGEGA
jgi:hypothetical protein